MRRRRIFVFSGNGAHKNSVRDVEIVLGDQYCVVVQDHIPPNLNRSEFDAVLFAGGSGAAQSTAMSCEGRVSRLICGPRLEYQVANCSVDAA